MIERVATPNDEIREKQEWADQAQKKANYCIFHLSRVITLLEGLNKLYRKKINETYSTGFFLDQEEMEDGR